MGKTSAKANARYISTILKAHGCRKAVIAPGSRNVPIILALTADSDFECISMADERSAAFTAMGMTVGSGEPVAVICSSGSAVVNFYPAVAEAFYRKLPLIVITADRPSEMIGQGIGQAIDQVHVFKNHIIAEANLLRDPSDELSINYNQRKINKVMLACSNGPVHINIPFDEPLYETSDASNEKIRIIKNSKVVNSLDPQALDQLSETWNSAEKVMVLIGQMNPSDELAEVLNKLNAQSPFLMMTESVSNYCGNSCISSIDRLISNLNEDDRQELTPDLLITIGGEIVSKRIRKVLTDQKPKHHWHVSPDAEIRDSFLAMTDCIPLEPAELFLQLAESANNKSGDYREKWLKLNDQKRELHNSFIQSTSYSDLKIYHHIFKSVPEGSVMHFANSTSVRYAQLFDHDRDVKHYANRGTSGIDGCTSTAIGHAMCTDKLVTLVSGDVAFLYDSNAFWNDRMPLNFRAIVINNGGGNIFRIIEGPSKNEVMERFQETTHAYRADGLAKTYGIRYLLAESEEDLLALLPDFFNTADGPAILEVISPRVESPEILQQYFKSLKDV